MNFHQVRAALGISNEERAAALAHAWERSQAAYPAADLPFLAPTCVERAGDYAGLPAHVAAAAVRAASRMAADPYWSALAWHCHWCLFEAQRYPMEHARHWPLVAGARGVSDEEAGLLYLLALLSGAGRLEAANAARHVPRAVERDTLADIQRWLAPLGQSAPLAPDAPRALTGPLWLGPTHLPWLCNHLRGELHHLVRLQFQFGALQPGALFYRRRGNGDTIALAEDGMAFRSDGLLQGFGGVVEEAGAWVATLARTRRSVVGNPLLATGFAAREPIELSLAEWNLSLAPGDPVLHLHIPVGSPMDFEQCGLSLEAAREFFPIHFPDRPIKAFACSSWLLDPHFEQILPASSNIVRFQREVYLLPSRSNGRSALERIFGHVPADLRDENDAPRNTTMRRALIEHLLAGRQIGAGRCVLFPQDLRWGSQTYRSQETPAKWRYGTVDFRLGTSDSIGIVTGDDRPGSTLHGSD